MRTLFCFPVARYLLVLFLCGVLVQPLLAQETVVRHYDWLTAGEVSGSHVLQIKPDGSRVSDFEFNDRGRGPRIHEVLVTGEDGMLTSLEVSGHSYMGAPAEEMFTVREGVARWQSTLESGETPEPGYYWANDGSPEQQAHIARALLANPDRMLPLLPSGKAVIRKLNDQHIEVDGASQQVSLYEISGFGFTPQYIWLDKDNELFALAGGWMGLTPQGMSPVLKELQDIQDIAEQDYHREIAKRLTNKLPSDWILRNVAIVDVENGRIQRQKLVAVSDGKIVKIMDDNQLAIPAGNDTSTRIIDGQGLTLVPGLWDMHTHLSLEDGQLQIAAGVTSVRDLANDPDRLAVVRQSYDQGEAIGPRSFADGVIYKKRPYYAPTGDLA